MAAAAALLGAALVTPASPAAGAATDNTDALQARVRAELGVFTGWLQANGAQGYIGEVGWPNNADTASWNALATKWYADAAAAGLWTTAWSAGEWWGCAYKLSVYAWSTCSTMDGSLSTARSQAAVVEAQAGADRRGLNMSGGEFGTPGPLEATSAFSNANPGTYNSAYHFDTQASFSYVASRGVSLVRLPVRWERVQPTLGGALNPAEVSRITDAVARAGAAGLRVILDIHNYGAYWLSNGTQGVRRPIGSAEVTVDHFASLWANLSTAFKANAGVAGYGLMNEPVGMAGPGAWEQASQAAVTAIRHNGDSKLVLVPGYNWSGAQQWTSQHPKAWITDTNIRYEAHHYWDRDSSGAYLNSYAAEVADAQGRGYTASPSTTVVIAGSAWYSDGSRSASGPAGTGVQVYAVNAVQGVPYKLVLATDGCRSVVATLNESTLNAGLSGLIGKVRGTVPLGTAPGAYVICFRNLTGPLTATGGLSFTVT
jgi:hypothetical protein